MRGERGGEIGVAHHMPASGGQRFGDRVVVRGEQRHHLLRPHRSALRDVECQHLLDVILGLEQLAYDLDRAVAENAGTGRLGDVEVGLAGLNPQRDRLVAECARCIRVEMTTPQIKVASDIAVGDPAVQRGDHLDTTRPVLRGEDPLDSGLVAVGHADESTAAQHGLAACPVAEPDASLHRRRLDVVAVPVAQQVNVVQPDRVPTLDSQLEHQPVGKIHQIFVEHRASAHDRGLAVVTAVGIGARIVRRAHVFPLGCATRAEVAVAGRGQCLAQALRGSVEVDVLDVEFAVRQRF